MAKKTNKSNRQGRFLPARPEPESKPRRGPNDLSGLSLLAFTASAEKALSRAEKFAEKNGAEAPTTFNKGFLSNFLNTAAKWELINQKTRLNSLMENVESGMSNKEVIDLVSEVREKAGRKIDKTFQSGPK